MMRTLLCLAILLIPAGPLAAQGYGIQTAHYGHGCNPVFLDPPGIRASLDPDGRVLTIAVDAFPGCCNTFLVQRILAFGFAPAQIPLPRFGSGCTLNLLPAFALALPAPEEGVSIPLPPGLPPLTFYAQGAAHYFTTIGFTDDLALTDGLRVSLF